MKLIPSMDASLLDYMAEHYDAVIIESFGVGGLPSYQDGDYHAPSPGGQALERLSS